MTDATAEMANKTNAKITQPNEVRREPEGNTAQTATLDGRYRQIGISAVAAAVRYQGPAKNPAYAPAVTDWRLAADAVA